MDNRTYYYARVSSKEQNLDRQIAAFTALGVQERDIITNKESCKDLNRTDYTALKTAMLRRGARQSASGKPKEFKWRKALYFDTFHLLECH